MNALGLILTCLLLAGPFAPRIAAGTVPSGQRIEASTTMARAPQEPEHHNSSYRNHSNRYRHRRHYRHHGQPRHLAAPTPEPVTLGLLALGGMGLAYGSRRKKRQQDQR